MSGKMLCSLCRKRFASAAALRNHARDYHKARAAEVQPVKPQPREDQDEDRSEASYDIERRWGIVI
ncbi:MAG: hypothetical protein EOP02_10375 [Proteobacteria bacterium]|nr:MAG: hypothetical protein EOP02_10375 [Pseudomonadota bacterium]